MNSIFNTTASAFDRFFNATRRMGHISMAEREKLLLLWFFYYLKHDSSFLLEYRFCEEDDNSCTEGWFVNRELEDKVDKVFRKAMECLSKNTCSIKMVKGDCTSIAEAIPIATPENISVEQVLISNDADPTGLQDVDADNINGISFNDLLVNMVWTADSAVFPTNDSPDEDPEYLSHE